VRKLRPPFPEQRCEQFAQAAPLRSRAPEIALSTLHGIYAGRLWINSMITSKIRSTRSGGLAHWLGAPHTVIITAAFLVAGSSWFTVELPKVRAVMRPIYQKMGILPLPDIDLVPMGQTR